MPQKPNIPATSVLLIDGSKNHRAYWAEQVKRGSPDYQIIEVADGQSGMDLYRSRRIDCVVLELELPYQSGIEILVNLVPIARRPQVAVILLTWIGHRGMWGLAHQNGACACFVKRHMAVEYLDRAIQRAVAFVGQTLEEDRYRSI